jgi:hypothetical protein
LEEPREIRLRRFCAFLQNSGQFPQPSLRRNPPGPQERHEKAHTGDR